MDEKQTRRINGIFERALDLEGAARPEYLARFDPPTRVAVEELLAAHGGLGAFLEQSAPEQLQPRPLERGVMIGHFRVMRPIGSGSGGTVYEAEQESPRRHVALKVRLDPLGSDATHRRFREEAEILARLRHPAIAHVYEAGIHEDAAYFAMELIPEAKTLTEFVDRQSRETRLRLFVQLCDAVQHGHGKGVVHRDLKPGNILVPPDGQPKIIDFGIASVEGSGAAAQALFGTPPYMSPEQCIVGNEDVDARADVYALGVILYELLSNALPHETRGLPITEATRQIRDEPPGALPAGVPADLRAIVAKALRKDRALRYDTAAQLGDDVGRFLARQPVTARPAGWAHQVSLFAHRHTGLVATSMLLLAVLVGAVVVSSTYALQAREARAREEMEAYIAHIAAADGALRLQNVREAREHLDDARPSLRGWEWDVLADRLDGSVATYAIEERADATFNPAGTHVTLVGIRNTFVVTEFRTGKIVHVEELAARGAEARFHPAGEQVAIARWDGKIEFRATKDWQPLFTLSMPGGSYLRSVFSSDGTRFATGNEDGELRVWSLPDRTLLCEFEFEGIDSLSFDAAGRRLLAGTRDGMIHVLDVAAGRALRSIDAHDGGVGYVAFAQDGSRLVSASDDARVAVWDVESGRRTALLADRPARIREAVPLDDGRRLVTAHVNGSLTVWNLDAGLVEAVLYGHENDIDSLTASPDGKFLVTTSNDMTAKIWEVPDTRSDRFGLPRIAREVTYDDAGTRIAVSVWDGTVRVRRLDGSEPEFVLEADEERAHASAFSRDGTKLATAGDGRVAVWDLATRALIRAFTFERTAAATTVAFDASGRRLLWGDWSNQVHLYDLEADRLLHRWSADGSVKAVAFLPGEQSVLACARTGTMHLWDIATGAARRPIRTGGSSVDAFAFARDGRRIAVAGDSFVWIYTLSDWALQARFELPDTGLGSIDWGRNDSRIAVGSAHGLRLLHPDNGRIVWSYRPQSWIWGLAFAPDGEQLALATGSYSGGHCRVEWIGRAEGRPWPPREAIVREPGESPFVR
ncbi:MAG: protein kinase [Planctomycetota bacterium]